MIYLLCYHLHVTTVYGVCVIPFTADKEDTRAVFGQTIMTICDDCPDDKHEEEGVGSLARGVMISIQLSCLQAGLLLTMSRDHVQRLGKVFWEPGG